jgi:Flp pilus assembly protein TadG
VIASIDRFVRDRRGAIAIIFGISLVPMAMLVALSIDFSFYVQARAQISLAADAAATHAIRAATETYTAEINQSPPLSSATAIADADAAGETAGAAWFWAQLGTLPTARITGSNNPDVKVQSNTNLSPTNPAGFTATVAYTGTYPPFFDPLFSSSANWKITGTAGALSTYSYVEILMLLDNSGSMDIGATPNDILNLEDHSVCLPNTLNMTAINGMGAYDQSNPALDIDMTKVAHYQSGGSPTNISGTCASGYTGPESPCGFACHTDANNNDLYGIARQYGVRLRSDVVISAAENVISSMEANEQAPDQFSVGVYQFNTDIAPLFPTQSQIGTTNPEASTDLEGALSAVDAIDYYKNPTAPVPTLPNVSSACCETDFPVAVQDLLAGTYSNGMRFGSAITAAGSGNTQATPQKDVFIVTDGMQDSDSTGTRENGEMTSAIAENASYSSNLAVCKNFKSLGFTVYVLYIDYNSLPNEYYMTQSVTPTPYFTEDFPNVNAGQVTTQEDAEPSSTTNGGYPPGPNTVSPDEAALQACASSPSDFFVANNAADISTAMNAMLKSALSTTIRLTQ